MPSKDLVDAKKLDGRSTAHKSPIGEG
ncbi:spermidine/putrescine ABC transporter ATP-binding protein, partial [Bacillus wiedmannii]